MEHIDDASSNDRRVSSFVAGEEPCPPAGDPRGNCENLGPGDVGDYKGMLNGVQTGDAGLWEVADNDHFAYGEFFYLDKIIRDNVHYHEYKISVGYSIEADFCPRI